MIGLVKTYEGTRYSRSSSTGELWARTDASRGRETASGSLNCHVPQSRQLRARTFR